MNEKKFCLKDDPYAFPFSVGILVRTLLDHPQDTTIESGKSKIVIPKTTIEGINSLDVITGNHIRSVLFQAIGDASKVTSIEK